MVSIKKQISDKRQQLKDLEEEIAMLEQLSPYEQTLLKPLSEFPELSTKTRNALVKAGKETFFNLAVASDNEIINIRGIGEKGFDEVLALLDKYHIRLI